MTERACDGAGLLAAFRAAVANLEAHVDEVNALNVFPVPDGDTGSNMLATARAALAEAETLGPAGGADRIAAAAAFGALMGARGNSGVIASQILRGLAEALAGKERFGATDLAAALDAGTRAAYGAVARPVEGTILTVIREGSDAAVARAAREPRLEAVVAACVDEAEASVGRTPSLLPILRDAGVVDSGGQGLYRLLEGAQASLGRSRSRAAAAVATQTAPAAATQTAPAAIVAAPAVARVSPDGSDDGFGFETMYLLEALPGSALDARAVRDGLEAIGHSVLVAGDERALKVHVHSERPDDALAFGRSIGTVSRVSVENLDHQARDLRERRAVEFAGDGQADGPRVAAAAAPPRAELAAVGGAAAPAVVAVAAGDGLAAIFRDFGVACVVSGGPTSNPSTGELLSALRSIEGREVLVLPNHPNVVLAARQAAALADRPVAVVPTRNAAEGFAALLAMDPSRGAAANAERMTAAVLGVQTLSVAAAVRDATIGGRRVRVGQWLALDPDDGLVAVEDDAAAALLAGLGALDPTFELITIYFGAGADLAETERLALAIRAAVPSAEVEVVDGGQPHSRYLVSAE